MKRNLLYQELNVEPDVFTLLPLDPKIFIKEGEIKYKGEFHTHPYDGRQLVYSMEHQNHNIDLHLYGFLGENKNIHEDIMQIKIKILDFEDNIRDIIKKLVFDKGFSTGKANITHVHGNKTYLYDTIDDKVILIDGEKEV